jgi:hypothetical protein
MALVLSSIGSVNGPLVHTHHNSYSTVFHSAWSWLSPRIAPMPLDWGLDIRRDVCLSPQPRCNSAQPLQIDLRPRATVQQDGRETKHLKGTTVLIYAQHHESADWANLLHWLSACLYVSVALGISQRSASAMLAQPSLSQVRHVLLPQIQAKRAQCTNGSLAGRARRGAVTALLARGAYSEMFLLTAFATARAVGRTLGSTNVSSPRAIYCSTTQIVCMDALVYVDPTRVPGAYSVPSTTTHARHVPGGFTAGLRAITRAYSSRVVRQCERWREAAFAIGVARASHKLPDRRHVVVLTRRTQSVWTNRATVIEHLRAVVLHAGVRTIELTDAGDAESLGLKEVGPHVTGQHRKCYVAEAQLNLWHEAYAVISPVGAHLANLVFMQRSSRGLVQSNNCGFNTLTYSTLANACGIRHTTSRETRRHGKPCQDVAPEGGFHAGKLDGARVMDLSTDTLGTQLDDLLRPSTPSQRSL